ncbi:helix-turn-helix transcriptional regulator [Streptomyces sp. KM273126]|uniref:helix-turn-helix domain-containing protein n=1 Tax=Streptomyces sp. KM273126 TaxID=2545247 RepID=UPI00215DA9B1|nr:helix-turn-helix transcriptional regulator [Streptomyces sp. KM273126]
MAALTVVRDLCEHWAPASVEKLEQFETDALSGFVLARASAGLADGTIRGDLGHLDQIRSWFGRPLWDMEPADADSYLGKVVRGSPSGTRLARSQALTIYFMFLELRHEVELHRMTGRVIECPIAEMNRPRGTKDAQLRIPPSEPEVGNVLTEYEVNDLLDGDRDAAGEKELAERCGIGQSLMYDIEAGRASATPAILRRMAAPSNCSWL